jgi:prepilin-type N-terminal cleavage/methylation domain-containing protein
MKTLHHLKKNRGFTLIELMISVCIMAIAFAGLATMQIACINGNSIASNLTTGITLAQDKMEELNSLDYNDPALADINTGNSSTLDSYSNYDYREEDIDPQGEAGGVYSRICNVADDTPLPGRKTIVVIVTWQGHRVRVSSIIGAPHS